MILETQNNVNKASWKILSNFILLNHVNWQFSGVLISLKLILNTIWFDWKVRCCWNTPITLNNFTKFANLNISYTSAGLIKGILLEYKSSRSSESSPISCNDQRPSYTQTPGKNTTLHFLVWLLYFIHLSHHRSQVTGRKTG